jgi:HK97 family phage portal protein
MKFIPASMSPTDVAFNHLLTFLVQEAARVYRIPASFLEEDSRSTFNNFEQKGVTLQVHVIRPWVKRWEWELNRKLPHKGDRSIKPIRFNMNSLARGDMKARAELYRSLAMTGIRPNTPLSLENMEGLGDIGEIPIAPSNYTQLQNLANNVASPTTD